MADPIIGIEYMRFKDIETDVELLFEDLHFGFAVIPLSELSEEGKFKPLPIYDYKFDWANKVLGVVPPSINVDSDDKVVRKNSEDWLEKNFKWAIYTNVSAIMIDLTQENNYNLVRLCAYHLRKCHGRSIWFRIKVDAESDKAWDTWNNVFSSLPENKNKVSFSFKFCLFVRSNISVRPFIGLARNGNLSPRIVIVVKPVFLGWSCARDW